MYNRDTPYIWSCKKFMVFLNIVERPIPANVIQIALYIYWCFEGIPNEGDTKVLRETLMMETQGLEANVYSCIPCLTQVSGKPGIVTGKTHLFVYICIDWSE